jgi:purine nucleosidase
VQIPVATLSEERRHQLIAPPSSSPVEFVLDTDTKNEIDDQFALVYALTAPRLRCLSVYAAPFVNRTYTTAAAGMEASYQEIYTVLEHMRYTNPPPVLRGSDAWITGTGNPVDNPAVRDLITRCQGIDPLVVVAIGALTNIASAILLEPKIINNMVLVWLGGQPEYWHTAREYNLSGDLRATQIVLDSGVPLVRIPCKNVAEHMRSVPSEIAEYVGPCGEIGAYLSRIFSQIIPGKMRSKVIWDLVPLAWLSNPDWVPSHIIPTPRLRDDQTWDTADASCPVCRVAIDAKRDHILADFVQALQNYQSSER